MEDCRIPRCHESDHILCRHRFNFDAHVIHGNGYFNCVELMDHQVILHFLYYINHGKVPRGRGCRYVIVTGDGTFLRDAKNEWESKQKKKKKKKGSQSGRLEFGDDFVRNRDITVHVENFKAPPYGWNKDSCRRQIVRRLNELYSKTP